MYKNISDLIKHPVCDIFNCILKSGVYPDRLKVACITPIFKSGDPCDINNYRPISGLPVLNIIIENLLYSRFISFINQNNILIPKQYGFRQGLGTTALMPLYIFYIMFIWVLI